jgi:hypothetical protein
MWRVAHGGLSLMTRGGQLRASRRAVEQLDLVLVFREADARLAAASAM